MAVDKDTIIGLFPEINDIKDEKLRGQVVDCWLLALEMGGWDDPTIIPWTMVVPGLKDTLVEHTQRVTKMVKVLAEQKGGFDMDLAIAGAILHDIGKPLEYTQKGGEFVLSEVGVGIRHPVSGAGLAMMLKMPWPIVHIIGAHSKEGDFVKKIPETILIHHVDFIDFDIAKLNVKK